jgi:hypothetical protein
MWTARMAAGTDRPTRERSRSPSTDDGIPAVTSVQYPGPARRNERIQVARSAGRARTRSLIFSDDGTHPP